MRKICLFFCIFATLLTLVGASKYEGLAMAAEGGELPESGLYIATNSFPLNTRVDVANAETGQKIQAVVFADFTGPGILALLSRDAAAALGIEGRDPGRVVLTQPDDPGASSNLAGTARVSGDPDFDPAAYVALNGVDYSLPEGAGGEADGAAENAEGVVDLPADAPALDAADVADAAAEAAPELPAPEAAAPDTAASEIAGEPAAPEADATAPAEVAQEPAALEAPAPEAAGEPEPAIPAADAPAPELVREPPLGLEHDLSLVPAETRPPEQGPVPDSSLIIPSIESAGSVSAPAPARDSIDPSLIIDPVRTAPAAQPVERLPPAPPAVVEIPPPPPSPAIFSAPMIGGLEKGKYYVQIGAFSQAVLVESEIARIADKLPVAIMNAGSADKPIYRILIGPLNLGESGALLQRFKATHRDAFVRLGT